MFRYHIFNHSFRQRELLNFPNDNSIKLRLLPCFSLAPLRTAHRFVCRPCIACIVIIMHYFSAYILLVASMVKIPCAAVTAPYTAGKELCCYERALLMIGHCARYISKAELRIIPYIHRNQRIVLSFVFIASIADFPYVR